MFQFQCGLVGTALVCLASPSQADVPQVIYVASCGTVSNAAGAPGPLYATTNGQLCISGSISATIAAFAPGGTYLNVPSVTTTGVNSVLPAGGDILVYNYGANPLLVKLVIGASTAITAATADAIIQPNSTQQLHPGSNTNIIYATTASTSSMQVTGGAGIAAGWGGGSSGGGGAVNLTQVGGAAYALGQTTMTASMPVTIASNQTAFPVSQSGTWNITNVSGTVSLPTGASTSALQPTNAAQGSTTSGQTGHLVLGAVTTGAPSYTTAQTSPLSLDLAGNLRSGISAVGGTGSFSNYGTAPGAVPALPINAFVTNTNANGQASMAASSPVTIASNQTAADPCMYQAKNSIPVSTNATALTQIIAASASTKIYICSVALVGAGATAFNLITGTGTNCGTATAAVVGSTTAANGMSFAANGGLSLGIGGNTVAVANVAGAELCTLQSAAVFVSGVITYVQQ